MPPLPPPLADVKNFSLNSAGVAGFFGGKEAISAMATVHLYKGRRWFGWFNSPGSYVIAKRFGRMANSRFWDGLFPGSNDSPAVTFGLDGKKGPKYIAALSGTQMETGHLAYLTIERSKTVVKEDIIEGGLGRPSTTPIGVTYLAMNTVGYNEPVQREPLSDALLGFIPISVSVVTCIMCARYHDWYSFSMILFGIIASGLASIAIGRGKLIIKSVDNPASGAPPGHGILVGNGEVVVIKGNEQDVNALTKGRFVLETEERPKQGDEGRGCRNGTCGCSKQGDEENNIKPEPCGNRECNGPKQGDEENGIDPKHADQATFIKEVVVTNGKEKEQQVEPITKGSSDLGAGPEQSDKGKEKEQQVDPIMKGSSDLGTGPEQSNKGKGEGQEAEKATKKMDKKGHPKSAVRPYHAIGFSSFLLLLQFLVQLLLIPQGTLFGQIMFLVSLGVSWGYNSYLSSLEKEKTQTKLLFQWLGEPEMPGFRAGTRTTMAVFVCLLLFHGVKCKSPEEKEELQKKVIRSCLSNDTPVWNRWLVKVMQQIRKLDSPDSSELTCLQMDKIHKKDEQFSPADRQLLRNLLKDAAAAIRKYLSIRDSLPVGTSLIATSTVHCPCDAHCKHCDCNKPI